MSVHTAIPRVASHPTFLGPHAGPELCKLCNTPGLVTELYRDPFIYGVGDEAVELVADIPVHTCSGCDTSYAGEEAEVAQHEAVCNHLGILTPAKVRELRNRYGLSRAAFARVTGFGEATVARWETGEVAQNISSDRYLRLLRDTSAMGRLMSMAESSSHEADTSGPPSDERQQGTGNDTHRPPLQHSNMNDIPKLEQQIRDLINDPRKHQALFADRENYFKLCSCLDVIGDTECALQAFDKMPDEPPPGSTYILVYGFLQVLFVQQDAVRHLSEALGLPNDLDSLKKIREVRNDAIGHPTSRRGGKSFSYISRHSLKKSGFQLMKAERDTGWLLETENVNLKTLASIQHTHVREKLAEIVEELKKEEAEHRREFRDQKLGELFPKTSVLLDYFAKLSEGVRGSVAWAPKHGALHLSLIGDIVKKFEAALDSRQIKGAYEDIEAQLEQLNHSLARLHEYFACEGEGKLNPRDAEVFERDARCGILKLEKMARALDDEYATEP